MLERKWNKKTSRINRFKSMLHYIFNLCGSDPTLHKFMYGPTTKKGEKNERNSLRDCDIGRRAPGFFEHVVEVYNKQRGLCAISGLPMLRPLCAADNETLKEFQYLSIDRIDDNIGYVKGNIQLTTRFNNWMKTNYGSPGLLYCIAQGAVIEDIPNVEGATLKVKVAGAYIMFIVACCVSFAHALVDVIFSTVKPEALG